jgi:hypothetical protein
MKPTTDCDNVSRAVINGNVVHIRWSKRRLRTGSHLKSILAALHFLKGNTQITHSQVGRGNNGPGGTQKQWQSASKIPAVNGSRNTRNTMPPCCVKRLLQIEEDSNEVLVQDINILWLYSTFTRRPSVICGVEKHTRHRREDFGSPGPRRDDGSPRARSMSYRQLVRLIGGKQLPGSGLYRASLQASGSELSVHIRLRMDSRDGWEMWTDSIVDTAGASGRVAAAL